MSKQNKLQHDIFYRKVFSKKKNLDDLLRNALPKKYLDKIDFDSIVLTKESFVGGDEKPLYSDMIINAKMNGKDTKISILIEHKAKKDRFTLLQMLKYLALLWDEEKNNNKELTPVVPVLIYHGVPKWDSSNDMSMCFSKDIDNDLKHFIPMFDYITFDLGQVKDEKLLGNIEYMIAVKIMKYIHKNLLTGLRDALVMLSDYLGDKSLSSDLKSFLSDLISYINNSEDIEPDNINELVETVNNSELKEVLMTLEKKYEIKYKKEKALEIAKKMKEMGMDINTIMKATGLSHEEIEKI